MFRPSVAFAIPAMADHDIPVELREVSREYRLGRVTVSALRGVSLAVSRAIEVPTPVDYVVWTEEVAGFATRDDISKLKRRLILHGQLSGRTTAEMTAAGWEILPHPRAGRSVK